MQHFYQFMELDYEKQLAETINLLQIISYHLAHVVQQTCRWCLFHRIIASHFSCCTIATQD